MDEIDVLKAITGSLSQFKGRAALSHLPSHRIWVKRLRDALEENLKASLEIAQKVRHILEDGHHRTDDALKQPLNELIAVLPQLVDHQNVILKKLIRNIEILPVYQQADAKAHLRLRTSAT